MNKDSKEYQKVREKIAGILFIDYLPMIPRAGTMEATRLYCEKRADSILNLVEPAIRKQAREEIDELLKKNGIMREILYLNKETGKKEKYWQPVTISNLEEGKLK